MTDQEFLIECAKGMIGMIEEINKPRVIDSAADRKKLDDLKERISDGIERLTKQAIPPGV